MRERTREEFNKKFWTDMSQQERDNRWNLETRPSFAKHKQDEKERARREWGKWRAEWLDDKHIIALWKDMFDGDIDKVNEILSEKGYEKISEFPRKWDELYLDF